MLRRYGGPEDLELQDLPRPEPGPGEVAIRVMCAAVNDWDWGLTRGRPFYIRLLCGLTKPKVRVPGVDIAGEVVAVGADVQRWEPGDRVFGDLSEAGFGGFAEYVCTREDAVAEAPRSMSWAQAAALPHASVLALQSLVDVANVGPGCRLLVNGAGGGVGTLAVQMARQLGAEHVAGVDHGDKLELLRSVGYDQVHDYRTYDFTRSEERYDVVLDTKTLHGPRALERALAPDGRYVTVGGETGKLLRVAVRGRFAKGRFHVLALKTNRGLDRVREWCDAGELVPALDGVVPLEEAGPAIRRFGEGRHRGKIVLAVGGDPD